jgi:peroxiredoxin
VAVQDLERARILSDLLENPFPVLADPDHQAAEAYGVYNLLGDGIAAPSVFIINSNGQIVWSYIGKDAEDRPTAATLLDHLP